MQFQTYDNYHLLLIDDGSTDGTVEMVRERIQNVTVLKGTGAWWWSGSLQQGIEWLKKNNINLNDIVLFINDDVTFDKFFLKTALELIKNKGEKALLLAQLIDKQSGLLLESGIEADLKRMKFKRASSPEKINCLSTRGLFLIFSDLLSIGNFYPLILPHYWSDYEFTIRAHRKGFQLYTSKELTVAFDEKQTGFHNFGLMKFSKFAVKFFSKKSVPNPVYRSIFITLTAPKLYIPFLIGVTWINAFIIIFRQLLTSSKIFAKKRQLRKSLARHYSVIRVIIGSGGIGQAGWIPTDYPIIDVTNRDSMRCYFKAGGIHSFLAEHVWEHLTPEDAYIAAKNCFYFLTSNGLLRIAVPDGYHTDIDYINYVKPGGIGVGADDHKTLYNYRTLSGLLKKAGFKTKLLEWFDEHGKFNYQNWSPDDGCIHRSIRFDERNKQKIKYTSLIIDAIKP